jgi:hypothetical protein
MKQMPPFSVGSDTRMRRGPLLGHAFQLPGLVTDAMEAMHYFGADRELQLVFNLLRTNYTIAQ